MTAFRVAIGLTLAFLVASANGIAGIGYIIGGEFEVSLKAVFESETEKDERWQTRENGDNPTLTPKDEAA